MQQGYHKMSLEKALDIKHEFKIDNVIEVILKGFEYQTLFNVEYLKALDYVKKEYENLRYN
jgi:hypothetical protein